VEALQGLWVVLRLSASGGKELGLPVRGINVGATPTVQPGPPTRADGPVDGMDRYQAGITRW
jgi:hypothetical protein